MAQNWIVEQIAALRDYARLNGLPSLAAHLEEARLLALTEMAQGLPPAPDEDRLH